MLVGIPAGSNVSNSAFKGAYTAGTIDYPNASITDVREATFTLNSDGAGNIGNVAGFGRRRSSAERDRPQSNRRPA